MVNNAWEYFKAQQRALLSSSNTGSIYARRKIDVEPVFGRLKASLGFNRFSVRGSERVEKEMGIVVLAMNINKLVTVVTKINKIHKEKVSQKSNFRFLRYFSLIETTYVTASFYLLKKIFEFCKQQIEFKKSEGFEVLFSQKSATT